MVAPQVMSAQFISNALPMGDKNKLEGDKMIDRYPQCYKCQLNQDGICKHNNKPVKSEAGQIFGICPFVKWLPLGPKH